MGCWGQGLSDVQDSDLTGTNKLRSEVCTVFFCALCTTLFVRCVLHYLFYVVFIAKLLLCSRSPIEVPILLMRRMDWQNLFFTIGLSNSCRDEAEISPELLEAWEGLPLSCNTEEDCRKFYDFVEQFGTHVIKSVSAGSRIQVRGLHQQWLLMMCTNLVGNEHI